MLARVCPCFTNPLTCWFNVENFGFVTFWNEDETVVFFILWKWLCKWINLKKNQIYRSQLLLWWIHHNCQVITPMKRIGAMRQTTTINKKQKRLLKQFHNFNALQKAILLKISETRILLTVLTILLSDFFQWKVLSMWNIKKLFCFCKIILIQRLTIIRSLKTERWLNVIWNLNCLICLFYNSIVSFQPQNETTAKVNILCSNFDWNSEFQNLISTSWRGLTNSKMYFSFFTIIHFDSFDWRNCTLIRNKEVDRTLQLRQLCFRFAETAAKIGVQIIKYFLLSIHLSSFLLSASFSDQTLFLLFIKGTVPSSRTKDNSSHYKNCWRPCRWRKIYPLWHFL